MLYLFLQASFLIVLSGGLFFFLGAVFHRWFYAFRARQPRDINEPTSDVVSKELKSETKQLSDRILELETGFEAQATQLRSKVDRSYVDKALEGFFPEPAPSADPSSKVDAIQAKVDSLGELLSSLQQRTDMGVLAAEVSVLKSSNHADVSDIESRVSELDSKLEENRKLVEELRRQNLSLIQDAVAGLGQKTSKLQKEVSEVRVENQSLEARVRDHYDLELEQLRSEIHQKRPEEQLELKEFKLEEPSSDLEDRILQYEGRINEMEKAALENERLAQVREFEFTQKFTQRSSELDFQIEELRQELSAEFRKIGVSPSEASGDQIAELLWRLEPLEGQVKQLEQKFDSEVSSISVVTASLDALILRVEAVESLVKNLEFDKQWLENLECSLVEIKKSQTEHESVHSLVDSNPDFEERLSKLENSEIEIEKNEEKLIQLLRAQLAQMREEFHGLIASVSDGSDKKIGLVDAQIKMIVERLEAMGAHSTVDDTNSNEAIEEKSLDTAVASFERLMSEKEDTIQALHAEVRALSVQKPVPELAGPDNLDAIDGIGKGTRRWLESDLGIRTFRDLALVSEDKLSEIISRLHFKDRVFRDNWIGQARELHHQKYKEWLPENPVRRKNGFF